MAKPKRKAAKLPLEKRRAIAKYREKNPDVSFADIAEKFNATRAQAENAWKCYREGKLGVTPNTKTRGSIRTAMSKKSPDALMAEQLHKALAEMSVDHAIVLSERVDMIDKITRSMKSARQMSLHQHIRGADAEFIAWMYRKYVAANLSDEEIIKKYQSDSQQWKIDSAA